MKTAERVTRYAFVTSLIGGGTVAVNGIFDRLHPNLYQQFSNAVHGHPIFEQGSFATKDGIHFTYINYTPFTFHPDRAETIANYYQQLNASNPNITMTYYGKQTQVRLSEWENPRHRMLFLVNNQTNLPSSLHATAATISLTSPLFPWQNSIVFTYNKDTIGSESSRLQALNTGNAVELCQELTKEGNPDEKEAQCNSEGLAVEARQKGYSYPAYQKVMQGNLKKSFSDQVHTLPLTLSPSAYAHIPFAGEVFTSDQ